MGIRLDWEVESEERDITAAREDPSVVRARRSSLVRFIFTLLALVIVGGGLFGLAAWRLNEVDRAVENQLRATIEAEVTALRLGDQNAYLQIQRSATEDWYNVQRANFAAYQSAKTDPTIDIQLPGTVRNMTIDGQRARVLVEEIVNGTPYLRAWFYWRYDDGWRHVPQDVEFWGDTVELRGLDVTVIYRSLDEQFALDMGVAVESWVDGTCGPVLQCGDLPHITLEVVPDALPEPQWDAAQRWTLRVSSPYRDRARTDRPFSGDLQIAVANTIAIRLIEESAMGTSAPVYFSDAYYLRPSIVSWLVGRYVQLGTNAHLVTSLATNYGPQQVGALLAALQPDSSVAVLAPVVGVGSLAEANLDWRDFLTWRLQLENELYTRNSEDDYASLYAPEWQQTARERFRIPFDPNVAPERPEVTLIQPATASDGTPLLNATVVYTSDTGQREGIVTFRLVDNVWKRAS